MLKRTVDLPPEVVLEIREIVEMVPYGQPFSVTIDSNGSTEWKAHVLIHRNKVQISTASYSTTTGWTRERAVA